MRKKNFFISTGIWAKIFYLFSIKVREGFQNCILPVQGKILRKNIVCFGKQKYYLIFLVLLPKTYRKTFQNCILRVQRIFFRGKRLLKTPQNCLSILKLEADHFWNFGKTFSIRLSKLLFMCPKKRFVEKSLFKSSKIWEKFSGISGKKRDLHSVLSKTALSVWRESLTEIPSELFSVFSRVS